MRRIEWTKHDEKIWLQGSAVSGHRTLMVSCLMIVVASINSTFESEVFKALCSVIIVVARH